MPEKPPEKEKEEYELIPISPLRRLEKRIDQLEQSPGTDPKDFFHELVDIVRMNQQLVDELIKANDSLRVELSRLPGKIEDLTKNLSELISYIRAAATEEVTGGTESSEPLIGRLDQLIETNKKIVESNGMVTNMLEGIDRKLKPTMSPIRKPLILPPKPLLVK
jgi:hypothetical protein